MASVEKDVSRAKTPWVVRWRDEAGKQRKRGFARKVDADRFRAEVEHSLNAGTYRDPAAGRVAFEPYAEQWRRAQPHRPNTASRTESGLRKHAYPAFGTRPISSIRESQLQAWVTGLPLAPSSVRTQWSSVRAVFAAAKRDRIITIDPTEGVKLPELDIVEIVPLLVEQVDALAEAVPGRYRALVEADAGSGLRQGEAFGLEVPHVDFLRGTIKVQQQIQPATGHRVEICKPKNRHSVRTVPVGRVVTDALARHLAAYPARDLQVVDTTGRHPVTRPARLIFTTERGLPLHRGEFNERIWGPARESAGLPGAGMHDLRHFFASLLIRAGLSPKVVAKLLGHANAAMTLNVYSHLWPDDEDRSREAVDAVLLRSDVPILRPKREA
ncbi:tyrosine-type recombinase/integrase [Actinoplanes solisilvae]|uniref:tyrosine-type recombinase/integrase n=1 Tax=Actinoplanes solisilvae TaxID=2486853 RepID=UPI0013E3327A|nr:site-specific integrase [Actinoplanes solisilvae]